ncbi:hypothetical protein ACG2LH_03045 [Zhouia sp. PK063]|uniref:hypothetical protein n=1 Tax=Zhouia sp. PK063 TaxID=3373602 RepID=UPI0037914D0F
MEKAKATNNNNYTYVATSYSWTGNASETTIKVENGNVISRKYEATKYNSDNKSIEIYDTYEENEESLGTHKNGAAIKTLDQLYSDCSSNYLNADMNKNMVYFNTDTTGIMNSCGYVPKNCVDDCFNGISIKSITFE